MYNYFDYWCTFTFLDKGKVLQAIHFAAKKVTLGLIYSINKTMSNSTASIEVYGRGGESHVGKLFYGYPLRLLQTTKGHSRRHVSICCLGFGGGSVSGDGVKIDIRLTDGSTACFFTQGTTKVFKSTGKYCVQETRVSVSKSFAIMIPDPVTPYADAKLQMKQLYDLSDNARYTCLSDEYFSTHFHNCKYYPSLVSVDWFSSGRRVSF